MKKGLLTSVLMVASMSTLAFAANASDESVEMTPWVNSNLGGEITEDTPAADLKDDFYQAVNYDWLTTADYCPGKGFAGGLHAAAVDLSNDVNALVTDTSLEGHDAKQIRAYYGLLLDWDKRNELGVSQLMPHVEELEAVSSIDELNSYLASEEGILFGSFGMMLQPGIDFLASNQYCLNIAAINLSLDDSAEYETMTPNGENNKKVYNEIASLMLGRCGYPEEEITEIIANSYAFEEMVASAIPTTAEKSATDYLQSTLNPVTLEELKELSPVFPLTDIMEARDYADWNSIYLKNPKFLERMNEVYTEENLELMKDYILVNMVSSYVMCVDEETFRAASEITRAASGASEVQSDEQYAIEEVKGSLSTSIDKAYTEKYLTPEMKEEIEELCKEMIAAYREMLSEEEWLSDETKEGAIEKLDNMTINSVYPDKWEETDSLNIISAEDGGTLWDANIEIIKYSLKQILDLKNTEVDPDLWVLKVAEVNAAYNPQDNSINIQGGILRDPVYSADMTIEEKLASICTVVGHEISHAFDTKGAQFDAYGNMSNWWTEEDYTTFSERAKKLSTYFDAVVPMPDGTPYSGEMIQTEAIADIGGVKCVLTIAKGIEDFDYDKFFRAYAKMWGTKYTPQKEYYLISVDNHPLDYLRVNTTCMQFDEFYETYGIEEGDGMYLAKEDRIAVW